MECIKTLSLKSILLPGDKLNTIQQYFPEEFNQKVKSMDLKASTVCVILEEDSNTICFDI